MSRVFTCICGQELRAESDEAIFRVAKEHATTKHADKRYSDQDAVGLQEFHLVGGIQGRARTLGAGPRTEGRGGNQCEQRPPHRRNSLTGHS